MEGKGASRSHPKPRAGRWRTFLAGLVAGPLLLLAVLLVLSNGSASWLSNRIAANMVPPDTSEMAVTAFSPPASTAELAAISGRGEGLDCSIEPVVEGLAFRREPGEEPVNLQYRQACVAHDYCYRHGAATYGYTQADCDATLARAALRICRFSGGEGDEACLTRVRKVYAGLVFGGAGAFRPARPDRGGATGFGAAFRDALERRFDIRFWRGPRDDRVAGDWRRFSGPSKDLWRMSGDGLARLLDAWLDTASTIGEYDPYPLGTARYAVPRLVRVGGRGRSLVFFKRRAGGSEMTTYGWEAVPGTRIMRACSEDGCGRRAPGLGRNDRYEAMPRPPQVADIGDGPERLIWWGRNDTGAESTSGNLLTAEFHQVAEGKDGKPVPAAWAFSRSGTVEMSAPGAYVVPGTGGDYVLASVTDQFRNHRTGRSDLAVWLWRGRPSTPDVWVASEGGRRVAPLSVEGRRLLPASGQLRGVLASPLRAVPSANGGVDVTMVTRAERPESFRRGLTAWSVRVPRPDARASKDGNPDAPPAGRLPMSGVPFDVPEGAEPAVPLGGAVDLRFVTIQCAPGSPSGVLARAGVALGWFERPRCSAEDARTIVSLFRRSGSEVLQARLPGRYVSRAAVVRNPAGGAGAPPDLLVLTRFALVHDRGRPALRAFVRVVGLDSASIWSGHEVDVGIVSPVWERSLAQALTRASRLYPIVGDVDGNGSMDLVLADPEVGSNSLAILDVVDREGVRPSRRSHGPSAAPSRSGPATAVGANGTAPSLIDQGAPPRVRPR